MPKVYGFSAFRFFSAGPRGGILRKPFRNAVSACGRSEENFKEKNMKDVIVLGGSFNPPTKAHEAVMRSAVEELGAEFGVFVPSSDAYVRRKMNRRKPPEETYPEETRLRMLESICAGDPRMRVSACEFGDDGRGHTYETLLRLRKEFPNARLWFLAGEDKLRIIPKWRNADALLRDFGIAVLAREGSGPEKAIERNAFLSERKTSFRFLTAPEGISEISSTKVRELTRDGRFEEAGELVNDETLRLMREESRRGRR